MRFVGKSKIGRLSAKKGKIYPQIRLSTQLADTIGEIADVFETERNGERAFLLVTHKSVLNNDTVLQPSEKVVKLYDEKDHNRQLGHFSFTTSNPTAGIYEYSASFSTSDSYAAAWSNSVAVKVT